MSHKSNKHRALLRSRRSVTLVELLIAASIFAMLLLSASTIFVNMIRTQKRAAIENYLATEGRFLMERMVREIRKGTPDYEQYYRIKVKGDKIGTEKLYGRSFGSYAFNFFDHGSDNNTTYADYRYKCQDGSPGPCVSPNNTDTDTLDNDTGKNPTSPIDENAEQSETAFKTGGAPSTADYENPELYLIDSLGKTKTLFSIKNGAIWMLRLNGKDDDQDGIAENWVCDADFRVINNTPEVECKWTKNISNPSETGTKETITEADFVSITPKSIKVTDLHFAIYPAEDPYKAFYESKKWRTQPRITIVMTLESKDNTGIFGANQPPKVTVQTTVSSQVYYNIPSYNKLLRF